MARSMAEVLRNYLRAIRKIFHSMSKHVGALLLTIAFLLLVGALAALIVEIDGGANYPATMTVLVVIAILFFGVGFDRCVSDRENNERKLALISKV